MLEGRHRQFAVMGLVAVIIGFVFLRPGDGADATLGAIQKLDHPALPFTFDYPAPLRPDSAGLASRLGVIATVQTDDASTYISVNKIGGPRSMRELKKRSKRLMGPATDSMAAARVGRFRAIRTQLLPSGAALGGVRSTVYQFNASMRSWVLECRTVAATRSMGESACKTAVDSLQLKPSAKPLTLRTWRRNANRICRPLNRQAKNFGSRLKSLNTRDYDTATMHLANNVHNLERLVAVARNAFRDIAMLRMPERNRGKVKRYIRLNREIMNQLDALVAAAGSPGDATRVAARLMKLDKHEDRLGRQLGIRTCTE